MRVETWRMPVHIPLALAISTRGGGWGGTPPYLQPWYRVQRNKVH